MGEWFNTMQPGYDLHLFEPGVSEVWLVRKPTDTGVVNSLELYDAEGQTAALSFCKAQGRRARVGGVARVAGAAHAHRGPQLNSLQAPD